MELEQPYKGIFNARISPELHWNIVVYVIEHAAGCGNCRNVVVEEESVTGGEIHDLPFVNT